MNGVKGLSGPGPALGLGLTAQRLRGWGAERPSSQRGGRGRRTRGLTSLRASDEGWEDLSIGDVSPLSPLSPLSPSSTTEPGGPLVPRTADLNPLP